MGDVIPIETARKEPASFYEIWFRERLDEQADAVYENILTLNRARALAEREIGLRNFRLGQVLGYDDNYNLVYEKVVGYKNGELVWLDPWV